VRASILSFHVRKTVELDNFPIFSWLLIISIATVKLWVSSVSPKTKVQHWHPPFSCDLICTADIYCHSQLHPLDHSDVRSPRFNETDEVALKNQKMCVISCEISIGTEEDYTYANVAMRKFTHLRLHRNLHPRHFMNEVNDSTTPKTKVTLTNVKAAIEVIAGATQTKRMHQRSEDI